jgi:hypothetical protein
VGWFYVAQDRNNLHGLGKAVMNLQHNMQGIFLPAADLLVCHEGVIEVLCIENKLEVILFRPCVSVLILNEKHLCASCHHHLTQKFAAGQMLDLTS